MSEKIKVACVQFECGNSALTDAELVKRNIEKAGELTRKAAKEGARIILLSELFERQYFCQERRYDYYEYATEIMENPAVKYFSDLCRELSVVMPISIYEKDGNVLYNSAVMLDADGTDLGIYRKTHIPDDHYYQEKFYFTPGNTGFKVWATRYGKIGVGICWDQWFPEAARAMALQGAEMLLYPTAIGSEPILETDSMLHWRRCMQGHAGSNLVPVMAANRVGVEKVEPCQENGGQSSSLSFYGSSFITDNTGAIVAEANRTDETVLTASFDLEQLAKDRLSWGLFRDRRPEMYGELVK